MDRIAGGIVVGEARSNLLLVCEVGLVDHHARGERVRFRDHKKAIQHSRVWLRVRRGEYDDHLIQIRDDDAFAGAPPWLAPRELRRARKDLGDHPAVAALAFDDSDIVADRQLETGIALELEAATQRGIAHLTGAGTYLPHSAGARQDPAEMGRPRFSSWCSCH